MFTRRDLSLVFLFLVNIAAAELKYDMKCDCGLKQVDENSEKDCEESARLESGDQEFNI